MNMRIRVWQNMSAKERLALTTKRDVNNKEARTTRRRVARIIHRVRRDGDEALRYYSYKYNGYRLPRDRHSFLDALRVSDRERRHAASQLSSDVRDALDLAIKHAQIVQRKAGANDGVIETAAKEVNAIPGLHITHRCQPIATAGLYVPRGRGSFPSMMVMQGVPARLAGVPRIVVATPPHADGSVDPATLYVADTLEISEIYKIGGVQGIAALALGTESIVAVDKIFGPGSNYVTVSRQLLSSVTDCGMPAGPSESMIIADEQADPRATALDLMIEAEHGDDSMALLVTADSNLIDEVKRIIASELHHIPQPRRGYIDAVLRGNAGGIIQSADYKEAVEIANSIAPEHLKIDTIDPRALADEVSAAGEILLGPLSAFSIANYLTGANSILPTNRNARSWSALSVSDFCIQRAEIEVKRAGFDALSPHTVSLANYEQFPAHAYAIHARNDEKS